MKRYLISILIIPVLVSVLLLGCNGISSSEPKASDYQQRIAELERQVAALTKQVRELSTNNPSQPRVIEKDVKVPYEVRASKEEIEESRLPFQLKAGDRVEGEVSLINYTATIVSEVRDPYGNQVVQTRYITTRGSVGLSGFPWRFAFIASTDGEYELRVFYTVPTSTMDLKGQPVAHLKIVVND